MADRMRIEIEGADRIAEALRKFRGETRKAFVDAGKEAGEEIIGTRGLKSYPPASEANAPPTPYYIRGRGMQYAKSNSGKSERYGTQYYVKSSGLDTIVGNRASYAVSVGGEYQHAYHAARGWRKLTDVANDKQGRINEIYNSWISKLLSDIGL